MASAEASKGTFAVKVGLAQMLKGGVIMDVVNEEQARIAEEAGAVAGTQPMCFALLRTTAASASPCLRTCRACVPTQWRLCAETHSLHLLRVRPCSHVLPPVCPSHGDLVAVACACACVRGAECFFAH
jgi:hypothetical protein